MKRTSLILALLFCLSIGQVFAQATIDIAVLLPDTTTYRWVNDDHRFFEIFLDQADVSYEIFNADSNALSQLVQAEQAIGQGARLILMVNLDSTSGAQIIELAHGQGVTIIDYDRLTIEGDGADYYVSFDNEAVGRLQGEGLVAAVEAAQEDGRIEGIPQVVMLDGSPTDNNATLFRNGAYEILEPYFDSGDWELVAEQAVPNWDYDQAQIIFEAMRSSFREIDAVLAANDGLAQAVINTLSMDDSDSISLTGQDATIEGIQNILAGRQSMTVYKSIRAEVEAVVNLSIAILEDDQETIDDMIDGRSIDNGTNEIPALLLVPLSVTIDNIAETVIEDGFRTWEEICVDDFEEYCPDDWDESDDD